MGPTGLVERIRFFVIFPIQDFALLAPLFRSFIFAAPRFADLDLGARASLGIERAFVLVWFFCSESVGRWYSSRA